MSDPEPLLRVRISVDYPGRPRSLDEFRIEAPRRSIVGLVGESGSGKSTAALAILALAHLKGAKVTGEVLFDGRNLLDLPERELRQIRGRDIALVLQSPLTALNPALRIHTQMREAWRAHARRDQDREAIAIAEALASVNLPSDRAFLNRRPAQLSVGQAQRVLIAMAILHRPRLLIADEPTSALDTINQAETLRLFHRLSREREMAMLYISHDLLSVASLCDQVAILKSGRVVECNDAGTVFGRPSHPYTRRLVDAIPRLEPLAPEAAKLAEAVAEADRAIPAARNL